MSKTGSDCKATRKILTLPPNVHGEPHGYLEFRIDGFQWKGNKTFTNIQAKIRFWGQEQESAASIWYSYDGQTDPKALKYQVVTTPCLFKSYLQHSDPVQVKLISLKTNSLIGASVIRVPTNLKQLRVDLHGNIIATDCSPIFSSKGFVLGNIITTFKVHLGDNKHRPQSQPIQETAKEKPKIECLYRSKSFPAHSPERHQFSPKKTYTPSSPQKITLPLSPRKQPLIDSERVEAEPDNVPRLTRTSTRKQPEEAVPNLSDFLLNNVPSISTIQSNEPRSIRKDTSDAIVSYLTGKPIPKELEGTILKEICNLSPAASLMDMVMKEKRKEDSINPSLSSRTCRRTLSAYQESNSNPMSNKSKPSSDQLASFLKNIDSLRLAVHGFVATKAGIKAIVKRFDTNNMNQFNLAVECQLGSGKGKSDNDIIYFHSRPLVQEDLVHRIDINKQNNCPIKSAQHFFNQPNLNLTVILWVRDTESKISYILGASRIPIGQMLKENLTVMAKTTIKMVNSETVVGVLSFQAELGCRYMTFGSEVQLSNEQKNEEVKPNQTHSTDQSNQTDSVQYRPPTRDVTDSEQNTNRTKVDTRPSGTSTGDTEILSSLIYFGRVKDQNTSTTNSHNLNLYLTFFDLFTNETVRTGLSLGNQFNFLKVMPVVVDDEFLSRMKHNFILVEAFEYSTLVATIKLPLHQFYIAFRSPDIRSHLSKGKMPVISMDGWNNLLCVRENQIFGQLQCLVAVGTEMQIETLKVTRGLSTVNLNANVCPVQPNRNHEASTQTKADTSIPKSSGANALLGFLDSLATRLPQNGTNAPLGPTISKISNQNGSNQDGSQLRNTSDLLEMLQKALQERPTQKDVTNFFTQPTHPVPTPTPYQEVNPSVQLAQPDIAQTVPTTSQPYTSDVYDPSLTHPVTPTDCLSLPTITSGPSSLQSSEPKTVQESGPSNSTNGLTRLSIIIDSAKNLPLIRLTKKQKQKSKVKEGKVPTDIEPSAYVTFEAIDGPECDLVKSHEGMVYTTQVFERSCNPVWNKHFHVSLENDYFWNIEKNFILKIWRKSPLVEGTKLLPVPLQDAVIGFTAVNLKEFNKGIPSLTGWYNIIDFNGRCNGQIKVQVKLLTPLPTRPQSITRPLTIATNSVDPVGDDEEFDSMLGRALKRKFNELEGISQRLKARLFDVTAEGEDDDFDPDDEFEKDLNTVVEDEEEESLGTENFAWLGPDQVMFNDESPSLNKTVLQAPTKPTCTFDTTAMFRSTKTADLFQSILSSSSSNNSQLPSTSGLTQAEPVNVLSQSLKKTSISESEEATNIPRENPDGKDKEDSC